MIHPNFMVPRTQPLTPRAEALQRKLEQTVDEFRRHYPDTSESDVANAIHWMHATRAKISPVRRLTLAVAAVAMAGGLAFAVENGQASGWAVIAPLAAAAAGAIVIFRVLRTNN